MLSSTPSLHLVRWYCLPPIRRNYGPGTVVTAVNDPDDVVDIESDDDDKKIVLRSNSNQIKAGPAPSKRAEIRDFHTALISSVLAASCRPDNREMEFLDVVLLWTKKTPDSTLARVPSGFVN